MKRAAVALSLLIAAPLPAAEIPEDLPELGMGLGGVPYYASAWVFADALRLENRGWRYVDPNEDVPLESLDERGNVIDLGTTGRVVEARPFQNNAVDGEPAGRYVLEWDGTGDVRLQNNFNFIEPIESSPNRLIFQIDAVGGGGLGVRIVESKDAPEGVRDVRLWMPDTRDLDGTERSLSPADQADLPEEQRWTSVFHPEYVEHLNSTRGWVGHWRFMDWAGTNNASSVGWDDRRLPTTAFATGENYNRDGFDFAVPGGGEGQTNGAGVPWEWMIELSNRTGRDAWVNVPHAASDEYARKMAQVFRYGSDENGEPYDAPQEDPVHPPLDPSLKLYVEYSNEIWSGGGSFRQGNYAQIQAEAAGIKKPDFTGRRAAELWDIFAAEFGDEANRLVFPAGAFTAVPWYTTGFLDAAIARGEELPTRPKPHVLAVTTYFGQPLVEWVFNETAWRDGVDYDDPQDPVVNAALDHLLNDLVLGGGDEGGEQGSSAGGYGPKNVKIARDYGLPLVAYEGNASIYTEGRQWFMANKGDVGDERIVPKGTDGAELTFSINNYVEENYGDDAQITAIVNAVSRHPRFADAYRAHLDIAKDLGLYTHDAFVDVGRWGKHGQWGHKESLDQPVGTGPGEAVKWAAVEAWATEHKDIRETGVGTEPVGTRPTWPDATLPAVFAGAEYDQTVAAEGGDGTVEVRSDYKLLPPGLTVESAGDRTLRVSGTVAADAKPGTYRFLARALDADGDPDWRVYAVDVLDPAGSATEIPPAADLTGDPDADRDSITGTGDVLHAGTGGRRVYLRFGEIPRVGKLTSATLRLHVRGFEGGDDPDGDGTPATARVWLESVPAAEFGDDTPYDAVPPSGEAIAPVMTITAGEASTVKFDVTDLVASGPLAVAVRAEVTGGANGYVAVVLDSKEAADAAVRPALVVEQSP